MFENAINKILGKDKIDRSTWRLTPQHCAICGGQLYHEDLLYFKGEYYHQGCFSQRRLQMRGVKR